MANQKFKLFIEDALIDAIVAVNFSTYFSHKPDGSSRAMVKINVRRPAEREEEVELWKELLREIPGVQVEYVPPASNRGRRSITFYLDELRAEAAVVEEVTIEMAFAA